MEESQVSITESQLEYIIDELLNALEPMVPYKINQLEFSSLAHEIKSQHIEYVLKMFPSGIVNTIKNTKMARRRN